MCELRSQTDSNLLEGAKLALEHYPCLPLDYNFVCIKMHKTIQEFRQYLLKKLYQLACIWNDFTAMCEKNRN